METETIVVTGCTGTVGQAAVKMLRAKDYNVIGTTRREPREGERRLNLDSLSSIVDFVDGLKRDGIHVNGLLNNAGTMLKDYGRNADGFERVTAANYIGTYLLSRLMVKAYGKDLRIANTVSLTCYTAHFGKDFFDVNESNYSQLGTYGNTKYAVMLFSQELARRTGNRVNMTDPGVVNSKMISMDRWYDPLADALFRPFCKSGEGGATPAVNAVTYDCSQQLFRGSHHKDIPHRWQRPELAAWLWDETEKRLKEKGIDL